RARRDFGKSSLFLILNRFVDIKPKEELMTRTPETTHKIMSAVKSKNTRPELALRRAIWARGKRYRVNVRSLPGKPDIVFLKAKIAVFCDGDFWHGHNWAIRGLVSLNAELERYTPFWRKKILGNIDRDKKNTALLEEGGWIVIRLWESDIIIDVEKCADVIIGCLNNVK
ncbi:MAG: very short patch repair endonuclease, partial [Planctomycetaceae bacterium]|nr:very short patch repair endonuclease [Planctomycetaceae bacterium]